jgi:hypothetical protein
VADADRRLLLLLPHVTGFRLLMAMLTHPTWPLPIWQSLQVRNRLSVHRPLQVGASGDLITHVAGWRVLEKGIEVDLQSWFQQGDECLWDSIVTFYYRGRFGAPVAHAAPLCAPRNSPDVDPSLAAATRWPIGDGARWHFGKLTGDYNGLHQWDFYARRFGFAGAFPHSQWVVAQCLGHLASTNSTPRQLDLWLKGPVYFGSSVTIRQSLSDDDRQDFALWVEGDPRPPLMGSLSAAPRQLEPAA